MIAIRRGHARVEETADRADDFGNWNGIGLSGIAYAAEGEKMDP